MKHPSLNNCDHIAQKIEMPFLDYEIGSEKQQDDIKNINIQSTHVLERFSIPTSSTPRHSGINV